MSSRACLPKARSLRLSWSFATDGFAATTARLTAIKRLSPGLSRKFFASMKPIAPRVRPTSSKSWLSEETRKNIPAVFRLSVFQESLGEGVGSRSLNENEGLDPEDPGGRFRPIRNSAPDRRLGGPRPSSRSIRTPLLTTMTIDAAPEGSMGSSASASGTYPCSSTESV